MLPITIGIPVYNEAPFIQKTIASVQAQPVQEIIISDNASTDATARICLLAAKNDSRVKYIRQKKNSGPRKNFCNCLDHASSRFFMFVGGHDLLSEHHAVRLLEAMASHKNAIGAYADVVHVDAAYNFIQSYHFHYYKELQSDSPVERLMSLITHLYDGSMLHGLYEKDVLVKALSTSINVVSDFNILGRLVVYGPVILAKNITYCRVSKKKESDTIRAQHFAQIASTYGSGKWAHLSPQQMAYFAALECVKFLQETHPNIEF